MTLMDVTGSRRSATISIVLTVVITIVVAALDFTTPANYYWPIAYGIPLTLTSWTRRKWWVWFCAALMVVLNYAALWFGPPPQEPSAAVGFNRALMAVSIALTAAVVH